MKKIAILLGMAMVVGLVSLSFAATSDTINLLVTPITNVSVNIVQTEYNYMSVALGNGTTVNTSAITVENDGDCQATWQHKATDATYNTSTWDLVYAGTAASTDEFRLWADISASQPGSFADDAAHRVATYNTNLSNGGNIPSLDQRNLWIKLEMPWSVTGVDGNEEHTCTYTVTATAD